MPSTRPLQRRPYAPVVRPRRRKALMMTFAAIVLALAVFVVDTLTPLQGAVAVLYVVVLLLVAATGNRQATVAALVGCVALTTLGFLSGHGWPTLDASMLRCAVSLAAILITGAMVLRNIDRLATIAGQARLIELTHDSIFVRDMDDVIVLWNSGAEQLYGWTPVEAIGRRASELLATAFVADRAEADEALFEAGRWEGELIQQHRDGRLVIVEARCALLRDDRGRPLRILDAGTDVTARRASDAALAESERRYRSIFRTARFSFWEEDYSAVMERVTALREQGMTDLPAYLKAHPDFVREACHLTHVTDVNDATVRMLGARTRADLIGPLDRFLPDSDVTFADVLLTVADGAGAAEGETHLVNLRGERLTVLFGISMPLGARRYDRVLVSVVDITDRKHAERALMTLQAELAQAARVTALGEMSASIAHEVNQPLAAIVTHGEAALRWLRRPEPDMGEAFQAIERVVADARRASEVVRRVRSLASKEPRQHVRFDLRSLLQECAQLLEGELMQHCVALHMDLADEAPGPHGDRVQLQQVVVNLMGNAIRAMSDTPGPRQLVIRARAAHGSVPVGARPARDSLGDTAPVGARLARDSLGDTAPVGARLARDSSSRGAVARKARSHDMHSHDMHSHDMHSHDTAPESPTTDAHGLLVEVEDTGIGIPKDIAPHLFDAFFTTSGEGMGMGLAICRSTIESHGGRLWASDRPGGGSIFHFTLPATVAEGASA